jgi:hypothetical protein
MPGHQWFGTLLRFQNSDGSWGDYTDLLGPQGLPGDTRWGISGSTVYYINGSVGIGTKNPTAKLSVNGSITASTFAGDGSQLTNLPRFGRPLLIVTDLFGYNGSGAHDLYYNLSSIAASDLIGDYLKIEVCAYSRVNVTQNNHGQTDIDIRAKPTINSSYVVSMPVKHFLFVKPVSTSSLTGNYQNTCETNSVTWYHHLNAYEKIYGVQIQIHVYSYSPTSPAGQYADFHNVQTIVSAV